MTDMRRQSAMLCIGFFVLMGFVLRCLAAQGGLWTDEAWSVIYAQQAEDVLGIFTRINHDNNHHLNSLWLQWVGPDASPMLIRGLSIVTGSITIAIAGLIGLRRNSATGIIAASLFAISPIMVVYGSEARGYAPMMLALMIMIWRIDLWLDERSAPKPALILAICALFGSFSHLTILPAVFMLGLWVFLAGVQRDGLLGAARTTVDLLGAALVVSVLCASIVILIAARSSTGLQIGGYVDFSWPLFARAISELLTLSTGIGYAAQASFLGILAIAIIGLAMFLMPWRIAIERKCFYAAMILTMPLAVAAFNPGNTQYARYYLPAAIAILFLIAEWIGHFANRSERTSAAMVLILAGIWGLASVQNYQLITSQRGNLELALQAMIRALPNGSDVTIAFERARAPLTLAAFRKRYPILISEGKCGTTAFHFFSRDTAVVEVPKFLECGGPMRLIASGNAIGPSGESWSLYQRQALPSRIAAVNSAPPRQR